MSQSTIIIGAGPAGLTSAYELSKEGGKSLILEADNQVGGLSRTVDYKGYRFDIGGHRFFSKIDYVNQIWSEILDTDFLDRPRLSRIYYNNQFFDYPLKALNALTGLGPVEVARVGMSYAKAKIFPTEPEVNLETWVSNRFGVRLYEIFFKTYTEKVWGIPCNEISSDWAAQRIKNLSLAEAVRSALLGNGKSRDGDVITTLIDQFKYPRFGPGMMWEKCEEMIATRGNQTIRDAVVSRLYHQNNTVSHLTATSAAGLETEYDGASFVSTMPLRELIFSLYPAPPEAVLLAAERLRYRDYLTVVLIVNRDEVFPDNWIYVHDPGVKMGRVQNYKNWSPDMVPDLGQTSLGLEYFLWETDEEWSWGDERLIEMGIRESEKIGLIQPEEVLDATVVRMKKAYPVYDGAYRASVDVIKEYLQGFDNLLTIGRNGLHRYNNQDHSMMTGVLAARNILGESHDVWSVNTEKSYHEHKTDRDERYGDRLVPERIPVDLENEQQLDTEIEKLIFTVVDPVAFGVAVGITSGTVLFLATAILLLKGDPDPGPKLALLGQYFWGYTVSWTGAFIGLLEVAIGFCLLGFVMAWLRNTILRVYLAALTRREEAILNQDLLDKL